MKCIKVSSLIFVHFFYLLSCRFPRSFFNAQIWCICFTPFTMRHLIHFFSIFIYRAWGTKKFCFLTTKIRSRVHHCKQFLCSRLWKDFFCIFQHFTLSFWLIAQRSWSLQCPPQGLVYDVSSMHKYWSEDELLLLNTFNEWKPLEMRIHFRLRSQEWQMHFYSIFYRTKRFFIIIFFPQLNICIDMDFPLHLHLTVEPSIHSSWLLCGGGLSKYGWRKKWMEIMMERLKQIHAILN